MGRDAPMKSTLLTLAMTGLSLAMVLPAAAKPAPDPTPTAGSVHSYILLDRTGSMSDIWDEALGSVNAYAASVGEADEGEIEGADIKTAVTLAVFDYQESLQFDVLRKDVTSETWIDVTNDEASPRGMTPLFDGHENSSREITRDGAKAALDRAKANGWEVVFLGAEFANFGDADAVGMSASKTMAVGQGRMQDSMSALAKKSRAYGKGEEAEIVFDDADRAAADEEGVKDRTGQ